MLAVPDCLYFLKAFCLAVILLFIVLLNHIGFCCSFFLHKLSWDEFQMWFIQLLSISHFSAIDFTYVTEFQTKIWWTYCPVFFFKVRNRGFLSIAVTIFRSLAAACCLASNPFVIFSLFPRIKITTVHIFIRGKKKVSYFCVNKPKGGKKVLILLSWKLQKALLLVFFSPPEVKLWSHVKHMSIHSVIRSYRI